MVVAPLQSRHLGGLGRKCSGTPSYQASLRPTAWMTREELFSNFQMMVSDLGYQYCYACVKKQDHFPIWLNVYFSVLN